MSSFNQTPSELVPDTPGRYYGRRTDMLSSQFEPSSPAFYARTPGSPSRMRVRRSELSSTLLGDDIGATSPLAYPSTPVRSSLNTYDSPQTPRTSTFVRTPFVPQTPGRPLHSSLNANDTQESDPSLSVRLIWGTTVNIHEAMTSFRNFLNNFTLSHRKRLNNEPITDQDTTPFYAALLNHIYTIQATNVNLDCRNLQAYPETHKLYNQLVKYPQEIIPLMDHTITEFYLSLFPSHDFNGLQLKVHYSFFFKKKKKEERHLLILRN